MSWMRHLSVCSWLITIHKSVELRGECQVEWRSHSVSVIDSAGSSSLMSTLNILISFYLSHVIWWIHANNPYFMKSVICVIATNNHCVYTWFTFAFWVIRPQVDSRDTSPFTPVHIRASPRYPRFHYCCDTATNIWHTVRLTTFPRTSCT